MRHRVALILAAVAAVLVVLAAYGDGRTGPGLLVNGLVIGVIVYLVVRFIVRSRH